LAELLPMQRADFVALLTAMDGLPATIRLLDPPLHEFLPDRTELPCEWRSRRRPGGGRPADERLLAAVERLHESNPMLGLRVLRLGLVVPGLFAMQVRAVVEAAAERKRGGGDPRVEIMVPLVGSVMELLLVRDEIDAVVADAFGRRRPPRPDRTMIELPRAALTARRIAESAEFFSFGTNDLTQTTWASPVTTSKPRSSRPTSTRACSRCHRSSHSIATGSAHWCAWPSKAGRRTRPDLKLGVCGEHGGDPESVHFFHDAGVDYVSCSPFSCTGPPRLEAGRAALLAEARSIPD